MKNYLLKFRTKSGDEYHTVYARDLDHAQELATVIENVTHGALANQYDIDELE